MENEGARVFVCGTRAVIVRRGRYVTVCASCHSPNGGRAHPSRSAAGAAAVKASAMPCPGCGAQ